MLWRAGRWRPGNVFRHCGEAGVACPKTQPPRMTKERVRLQCITSVAPVTDLTKVAQRLSHTVLRDNE